MILYQFDDSHYKYHDVVQFKDTSISTIALSNEEAPEQF